MTRDLRFRFTGIVFFLTFAVAMVLTKQGIGMCQAQLADIRCLALGYPHHNLALILRARDE